MKQKSNYSVPAIMAAILFVAGLVFFAVAFTTSYADTGFVVVLHFEVLGGVCLVAATLLLLIALVLRRL